MTLAASLLASGGAGAANSPVTSASFTPPANAKIYVVGWAQSTNTTGGSGPQSITDNAGLSWTQVATANLPAEFGSSVYVWEASTGSSPAAMTVTLSNSDSAPAIAYSVVAVTGSNPSRITGQVQAHVSASGTATATAGPLPSAAASSHLTLIMGGFNTDSGAPVGVPTGFTSLANPGISFESPYAFYSTTFASTSTTFANATDQEGIGVVILEIGESGALTPVTATRATTWSTRKTVTGTRATLWAVNTNLVSVTATRATTWSLQGRITATRSTTWFTDGPVVETWFKNDAGTAPQFIVSAEDWGLLANATLQNANPVTTWDSYFSQRQAQGYNAVEVTLTGYGTSSTAGLDSYTTPEGGDTDGVYPFATNTDPTTANNSTWWTRRQNFFAKAKQYGFKVLCNVTTPNLSAGCYTTSWTDTQWQTWGTKLGQAFGTLDNIYWMFADDYFGEKDAQLTICLNAMRAAGANQPVSIQYFAETDSRKYDWDGSVKSWGDTHADFYFGYSYNVGYRIVELGATEPVAKPYGFFDGMFLNSSTVGITTRQNMRRIAWQAVAAGAKALQIGDNNMWTWPVSAMSELTNAFYNNEMPTIASVVNGLKNWHELKADTSSALVTSGRGTYAAPIQAADAAAYYDDDSDNYVPASFIQSGTNAGTLAILYMIKPTTVTIDESKMVAGYSATWIDPVTGARTPTTAGPTYTKPSTANANGDTDWVLVLEAVVTVTATRSTTWAVDTTVTTSRATTWQTRASVLQSRSTTWNIASSLTQVSATRATTWATRAQVATSRATTWNVASSLVSVTASRATTWAVIGRVTASRSTTWLTAALITPTFTFTPPTFEAPMQTDVEPLRHYRLTQGLSVVRVAGVFTSVLAPSAEQLQGEQGTDWFSGGHIYTDVSADVAAELEAAGFTVTQND